MRRFLALLACISAATAAAATPTYRQVATIPLGAPDRWDYVVADPEAARIYVAHGDEVTIVDPATNAVIGNVKGIPGGTHGIAVARGRGFTDDGKNGQIVAFDLVTLKVTQNISADQGADAVVADPVTGRVFAVSGDHKSITAVDAATGTPVATINGGEKMEYAAADGSGNIYVAGKENRDVIKIDARTSQVVARWSLAECESPHGLAYDRATKRVFVGCLNSLALVVDARGGNIVARLSIGLGSDAIAFDAKRHRVFSSNGRDGTISVFQQRSADEYIPLQPIRTMISARTMAVEPTTGRLFVAAAENQFNSSPGGKPTTVPGSLRLLVFAPDD